MGLQGTYRPEGMIRWTTAGGRTLGARCPGPVIGDLMGRIKRVIKGTVERPQGCLTTIE